MNISTLQATGDGRYTLRVPLVRTRDDEPLMLPMQRPTGHYLIFLVGLANLVRLLLDELAPGASTVMEAGMYVGSTVVAGIAGHYAKGAKVEQTSRFASANVGLINFALGHVVSSDGLIVPGIAVALAMLPACVGEVLYRRAERNTTQLGDEEPTPATVS